MRNVVKIAELAAPLTAQQLFCRMRSKVAFRIKGYLFDTLFQTWIYARVITVIAEDTDQRWHLKVS